MQIKITLNVSDIVGISSDEEIKKEIGNLIKDAAYSALIQDYSVKVIR